MIVETAWFRTKPGVTEKEFLAASKKAYDGYLAGCSGLLRRELLKGDDGQWVDVVHFKSREDADRAAEGFPKDPSAKEFEAAIDTKTSKMMRFELAKTYRVDPASQGLRPISHL
jgi:hypothetical protein